MRTGEQAGGASASDSENATSAGATSTDLSSSDLNAELGLEQSYFDVLYEHLDALRIQAAAALADLISRPTANTPAALSDRDAFIRQFAVRVAQLDSVEDRLCFGKLDLHGGERRYIGRIGISDEHRNQLLVDWRAPAAEAFYQATAGDPQSVIRRRQLTSSRRIVSGIQDEVLDLVAFEAEGVGGSRVVLGEGALFASLDVARSGRMRDIVATIQADQDRAIRAPLAGVVVVQGGPGTGKTAVALHRAAYLLYANRQRIERSGVLVVGPNRVFLHYIEQVLPALGEAEAVLMRTPGELYPGVIAEGDEAPEVAALKGDLRMAAVLNEAVRRRQRTIERSRPLDVDGTVVTLRPVDVRQARDRARRSGKPHNEARVTFVREILRGLVRQLAEARSTDIDEEARAGFLADLHESPDVRREVNWCWAPLRPERLLRDLYAVPALLDEAGRRLTTAERRQLRRERTAAWTTADVALLDEAAELLGEDDTSSASATARAESDRKAEVAFAEAVQETFGGGEFISAANLADRYQATQSHGSVAERAAIDRQWAFGHVVIDEAQELSAMMWRVLMRRSPSRSMTIVGDIAQTGALAGATSWAQMLSPHVEDRWSLAELTVNYRTPEQIMDVAAGVVHAAGLDITVPTSARVGRDGPVFTARTGPADLAEVVRAEWEQARPGTVVVITSRAAHATVAAEIAGSLPPGVVTADTAALGSPVSVLTVADAKGLEFDTVVLVEPSEIVGESPRGVNDLYVALTRPTQRLHVVHAGPLPAGF